MRSVPTGRLIPLSMLASLAAPIVFTLMTASSAAVANDFDLILTAMTLITALFFSALLTGLITLLVVGVARAFGAKAIPVQLIAPLIVFGLSLLVAGVYGTASAVIFGLLALCNAALMIVLVAFDPRSADRSLSGG